jgi:AcrR family transcriptional regulator
MQKITKPNRQVERTKSWIFDALMLLMDEKPYNKITVSDIADKAGIARPTFYRNYNDKDDIVFNYLLNTLNMELLNREKNNEQNTIVLMFDHKYMIKHQKNLKKILSTSDIENRIFRNLQEFPLSFIKHYKEKLSKEDYLFCRYKICYQITGSLRVFFDWFINNMPMPAENIISLLNDMNNPRPGQHETIPNIVVRLKNVERSV